VKPRLILLALAVGAIAVSIALGLKFCGRQRGAGTDVAVAGAPVGRVVFGQALFEAKCSFCHYTNREETKMGLGLKGLLKRAKLRSSSQAATAENVRAQIRSPHGHMPCFDSLSEQEVSDILAYLKTL
jgi:mono/diheme cytochrome c family protein